ncbi:hypothetical protein A3860_33515 [Niastella vici]|uniref:Virulence plasmid A protein n=1 Tax=Niastella vici TaxID=1703345 RepID=A0A1V9FQ08_9BACT|nr:neuraminidase-like domain-containing protein [Niastella vici]OQP60444.1 hypothetical protein A3860_33515 [Niastella vici]
MKTFTIAGQLVNTNKQPLPAYKIAAWDKDKEISQFLGMAYTDANGQFTITYDDSRFFTEDENNLPDVFFLVYQGDLVIYSTEGTPEKDMGSKSGLVITVNVTANTPPPTTDVIYSVEGVVKQKQTGVPVTGIKVEAWDKDVDVCDQLGVAVTNEEGSFYIQYDASRFSDTGKEDLPDVFFRLYAGNEMIYSTESSPLNDVKRKKGIVIEIDQTATNPPPAALLPKKDVLNLSVKMDATPEALKKEQPDLYGAIVMKARQQIQKTAADFFAASSYDLQSLARSLDLGALTDTLLPVREYLETLIDKSALPPAAKKEASDALYAWNGPETLDALIMPATPLRSNGLFNDVIQHSDVYKVAEESKLSDTIAQELIRRNITIKSISPQTIQGLVADNVLKADEGKTLNLSANMYALAESDLTLYQGIQKSADSLKGLAALSLDKWKEIILTAQPNTDKEVLTKKALLKQKQIAVLYPHESFKHRSNELEQPAVQPLMDRFYKNNSTLNFLFLDYNDNSADWKKINLEGFSDTEKKTVTGNLKTNQRLYRVTRDATDTFTLKKNYSSANTIVNDSFAVFSEKTQLDASIAQRYYETARQTAGRLGSSIVNIIDWIYNPLSGSPVNNDDSSVNDYLRRLEGYEEYFGETDYCKCSHCASIISPVAYFVDLMGFVKEHVLDVRFTGTNQAHIMNPKKRRPDLWDTLVLNCENTENLVPYLVIINEVLENFIYTTGAGTGSLPPDRGIIEQFVYQKLSLESETPFRIASFNQPFHLPLTELNIYLKYFALTRASIANMLLADVADTDHILMEAGLNLSSKQYELITQQRSGDIPFLSKLYDITIAGDGTVSPVDVQHMLVKLNITRDQFTDLLATTYVQSSVTGGVRIVPQPAADIQYKAENVVGATAQTLDRIHRFIRLWRQLEWSITDLDKVVFHLQEANHIPPAGRDDLLPGQLLKLVDLQKKLQLTINEICVLVNKLPVDGSPSFFDQRFNLRSFVHVPADKWGIPNMATWSVVFRHPAYWESTAVPDSGTTSTLHRLLAGLGITSEELYLLIQQLQSVLRPSGSTDLPGTILLNWQNLSLLYRHALLLKKFKLTVPEFFFFIHIEPSITNGYLTGHPDVTAFTAFMDWFKQTPFISAELAFVLRLPFNDSTFFDDPATMAYDTWSRIQEKEGLLFKDTLFSYIKGISESQSKAVIAANASILVPADVRKYRIPAAALGVFNLLPAGVASHFSEDQQLQLAGVLLKLVSEHLILPAPAITISALTGVQGVNDSTAQQILTANASIFELRAGSTTEYTLTAGVRANPAVVHLNIPAVVWDVLSAGDKQVLYRYMTDRISSYLLPGAPEISDRLFAGVAGLGLDASRSIIAANPAIFATVTSETQYWLQTDFNVASPIYIPADIPLPVEEARALLLARHISTVLPGLLSAQLMITADKLMPLARLAGYDVNDAALTSLWARIAQATEPLMAWEQMIEVLQRMTVWYKDAYFDAGSLGFIQKHTGTSAQLFKGNSPADYRTPSLQLIQQTELYRALGKPVAGKKDDYHTVLAGFGFGTTPLCFSDTVLENLAGLLNADVSLVSVLNHVIAFPAQDASGAASNEGLKAFKKFGVITGLVQLLGIGGEILPLFISRNFDQLATAVKAIVTAIRTKYGTEEEWEEKIGVFEDNIRERKRDALTDYLIHTYRYSDTEAGHWFRSSNDLYNYFLIDTGLMGCARTSRVVAGISSLQLYIQRCLMNLEQSEDGRMHVLPADIPAAQWEWRKNYRVWEANRKVFLYPENYIEPDLRDDKTELFEELESTVLQQEITAQNVLDAYAKYMKGFEAVASLKMAGMYHDLGDLSSTAIDSAEDTLHIFGVSPASPGEYYYRTIKNLYKTEKGGKKFNVQYGSWEKLNVNIPVAVVSPIVYKGKLMVFWVEIQTKPVTGMVNGSNEFTGYRHHRRLKMISRLLDGRWSSVQEFQIGAPASINDNADSPVTSSTPFTSEDDNYTLNMYPWVRAYPSVVNDELYVSIALRRMSLPWDWSNAVRTLDLYAYTSDRLLGSVILQLETEERLFQLRSGGSYEINSSAIALLENYFSYAEAEAISLRPPGYVVSGHANILTSTASLQVQAVNGTLSDGFVSFDNEFFHLYKPASDTPYILKRLGTSQANNVNRSLLMGGLDYLMNPAVQSSFKEKDLGFTFSNDPLFNDAQHAIDLGTIDYKGPMGVYYREIFFQIPFLIANHLNSQGKYADAQRWYHFIFNPTAVDLSGTAPANPSDRVWQYIEFRNMSFETWYDNLNDEQAIQAYENDPFNPHAIARLRLGAYKKCIIMKYIDNLLDWGDYLFAQDTMESINEATLLYVMASEILGKRPAELGECNTEADNKTFNQVNAVLEGAACRNFLNSVEDTINRDRARAAGTTDSAEYISGYTVLGAYHEVVGTGFYGTPVLPVIAGTANPVIDVQESITGNGFLIPQDITGITWKNQVGNVLDMLSFHTSFLKQACIFCIPNNPDLLGYWDRVEDRLYKIRNCMNISGEKRQLALFAPEIDPRLLVRAKASGLSIDEILDAVQGDLPPYRFAFLLAKAKEYAGALQSFGAVLLGTLEKKNAEEMALLRLAQQDEVLKMTTRLRQLEITAAEAGLESLNRRKTTVQNRIDYYQHLLDQRFTDLEVTADSLLYAGYGLKLAAVPFGWASVAMAIPPSIMGMAFSNPTSGIKNGFQITMTTLNAIGELSQLASGTVGKYAGYDRREEGWRFSLQQSRNELNELEKQIEGATIRIEISQRSLELHEKSIDQQQEVYEFYRDKFTNLGLYTWMTTQLQRLYREAYQNTITVARMTERAYRFERNDETSVLLDGNYWDASRTGLMAGERLMNALREMELRYMETNTRSMELDQAFSLTQIDPQALLSLKLTGECEFTIPEFYFDLFYPGQYKRRMKSARLTIPCVTGPYSNVSALLTLKSSYIRKKPVLNSAGGELTLVPPSRSTSIATSTAQNDSGVFKLDFRDERYMPFEGAGAVESTWELKLPKNLRPFDYATINDVIVHISYTAEYDGAFRQRVEDHNQYLDTLITSSDFSLPRVFSLRQEFSQTFHRLLHSPLNEIIRMEFSEKHFPLFLQGKKLEILEATLNIEINENGFRTAAGNVEVPGILNAGINFRGNGTGTTAITSLTKAAGMNLYTTTIWPVTGSSQPFAAFMPASQPLPITLQITSSGMLSLTDPMPGDPSALDDRKVKDVYLFVKYHVVAES